VAVLLAATVMELCVLAGTYQPIGQSGQDGTVFPGLPEGTGTTSVNMFSLASGQLYVPPF
jgi:hypothetical protein